MKFLELSETNIQKIKRFFEITILVLCEHFSNMWDWTGYQLVCCVNIKFILLLKDFVPIRIQETKRYLFMIWHLDKQNNNGVIMNPSVQLLHLTSCSTNPTLRKRYVSKYMKKKQTQIGISSITIWNMAD